MSYEKMFKENMESLSRKHEHSKVYVDFMDYYIYQNSNSPDRKLPTGYSEKELEQFHKAYTNFCSLMKQLIQENGWYDYIGEYYEEFVLASAKSKLKGQFYTPRGISDLLSQMVGTPVTLADAYDPACGSARNLLDYHSKHPEVRCTGEDLDESACKMAVINFHLHRVNGVVNWIDALTREYMGTSWRILGDRIYITDMDMIRANDDIMNSFNILMLSDESIMELCVKLLGNANPEDIKELQEEQDGNGVLDDIVTEPTKTNKNSGGLDGWLK